ncbi:MAG: ABC transporter ATP-binding protein [Anaerolineaceae bacterium]|nr:ABC transporter ATP-binding protein [Anaerolineae bacterium]MCB9459066.1 ABC transporter ATP-binding protein [Anaerolineaceae bacterium]
MSDVILQAKNLRKEFGGLVAVSDVSLDIQQGSLHSIIGPNGAGKTTFFNLISGKYRPTSGQVIFQGHDITHMPLHQRIHKGMGRSFQITNIFPNLTVLENVRLAVQAISDKTFNFWRSAAYFDGFIERATYVLSLVGLEKEINLPANLLPHGGKRKLELAMLLAPDPAILLLDEPTAGMASEQVPELIDTINAVRQQENKTIVMIEHNMNVVMGISDRISVMNMGEMLAEGSPSEIAGNSVVQEVYLGQLYDDVDEMAARGGPA